MLIGGMLPNYLHRQVFYMAEKCKAANWLAAKKRALLIAVVAKTAGNNCLSISNTESVKMPGRQSHGRSLLAQPKAKSGPKKSKSRAQTNALNAFNIAQERFPTKEKKTPRARELDVEIEKKHSRDEEDEDEEDEEEGPKRKKAKAPQRSADGNVEFGSDSEGNEWQLGGMANDDDDSEIESDDAFGDSDNEMFQGYAFRGSKTAQRKVRNCSCENTLIQRVLTHSTGRRSG
jgi:hypothetical protein